MATSESLKGCISLAKVSRKNLPPGVEKAAKADRKDLMEAALNTHLGNMRAIRKEIRDKHHANIQTTSDNLPAKKFTSRKDDKGNELNTFKPIGGLKILVQNLVQRAGSVYNAAIKYMVLNRNERKVVNDFNDNFSVPFSNTVDKLFKPKEGTSKPFRHEDMIQYFTEHDTDAKAISSFLDPTVKEAIAVTAYEWLGTEATYKALYQTESSLGSLLSLEKDETVPRQAWDLLKNIGAHRDSLAANIGRTILNRLSITDTADSDALAKNRLEMSLGLMAIAAMQEMGIVKRDEVFNTAITELGEGNPLNDSEVFYVPLYDEDGNDLNSREDNPTMKFITLIGEVNKEGKLIPSEMVKEIEGLMDNAPETFNKLFNNDSFKSKYSFDPITLPKTMKLGRNKEKASKTQRDNIQKYTNTGWTPGHSMSAFEALMNLSEDSDNQAAFDMIVGKETMEGKLNIRKKSVEGIERGIDRDIDNVKRLLTQIKEQKKSKFFLPSDFMNNMRMLMRGHINPQNSKIHRNLFAPEGWRVSFNPDTNTQLDQAFHEAIALSLGKESHKEGGVNQQIAALHTLLNESNEIQDAIRAFREFDNTNKMTPEMMQMIASGVKAAGTKLHGFKGIQEYARYLNHQDKPAASRGDFTTDIYKEIDGVSNGPIIGTLMLISNMAEKQAMLATIAMGGISISRQDVNLDEKIGPQNQYLNDAYERMGQVWAIKIAELKKKLKGEGNKSVKEYNQAVAIGEILGPFQDKEGIVNKIVRNLSKPRTMQTMYGASIFRQSKIFTGKDLIEDGIYKKMEEIIQNILLDENHADKLSDALLTERLETLLKQVATLTDTQVYDYRNYIKADGTFDITRLSQFELQSKSIKKIEQVVNDTYGKAMGEAINEVYKSSIAARKPFLEAIQQSVTLYNTVLQAKVNTVIESKIQNKLDEIQKEKGYVPERNYTIRQFPEINQITKKELNDVLTEIEPLMPKIKTPLHKEDAPSYLPLASVGKTKQYADKSTVKQIYQSKTLPVQVGYAQGIPLLDPPGAAPMVKAIQMIDAMIANHLMGLDVDILNNHDGFSHGINASSIIREEANKRFFEIMKDYSLGQEIADMYVSNLEASTKAIQDAAINNDDVYNAMINDGVITKEITAKITEIGLDDITALIYENKNQGKTKEDTIRDLLNNKDKVEVVTEVNRLIRRDVETMGREVTDNKKEVMDHVTKVAQYPDGGEGYTVTPTNTNPIIFNDGINDIHVDKVLDIDATNTIKSVQTMQELMEEGFGSSSHNVSTNKNHYPDSSKVDRMNVTQIFETLVQQDKDSGFGSIPVSANHKTHLTRIMDEVVARVMTPVQLYITKHKINDETRGVYKVDGKDIFIQTQKFSTLPKSGMLGHSIRMSAAEVYAHELTHHITDSGLKQSPYYRNQAYNLYEFTRNAFEAKYGNNAFQVFMNDPNADINDPANAFEIQAAKARWDYIFNPVKQADNSNHGVAEFLAFGLTNENFKRELATLTLPDKPISKAKFGIFEKNVQTTILNLFNKIMDFIHQQFFKQEHSKQADIELENLVRAISELDMRASSSIYSSFVKASDKVTSMSLKMDEKTKSVASEAMNITQLGRVITKLKKLPEANNMISHQMRLALNWYGDQSNTQQGLLHSIATEVQGTTNRMQPLHTLLNRRKRVIDAAKQEAAESIRNVVNSWFYGEDKNGIKYGRERTSKEKEVYTTVGLKTDLSYLIDKKSKNTIIDVVSNEKSREDRIDALIQEMNNDPDISPHRHLFYKAADDLGYYMVTSSERHDGVVMMNAQNIVGMKGTKNADALTGKAHTKALNIVEELATLYALGYVPKADKRMLVNLMNEDWNSFENILGQHNLLKKQALVDSFDGMPAKMQKGYVKSILNDRIQYTQGTLQDVDRFTQMGYTMEQSPLSRDPNDPVQQDIYMFQSNTGMINPHQSGITSMTTNTKKGADAARIQHQIGNEATTAAEAQKNTDHMVAVLHKKLEAMAKPTPRKPYNHTGSQNYMIPHFDDSGNIIGARYMMNEYTKDHVLQQFKEVDAVLGAMSSQIIDKKYTPIINNEVVVALKELYDKEFKDYPREYIDVSPTSQDPQLRDIYNRFPEKMKNQIYSVWGRHGMMVNRDVLVLAFGQEKYSIVEVFKKDKKNMKLFQKAAMEVMTFALGVNNPFVDAPLNTTKDDSAKTAQSKQMGRAVVRAKRLEELTSQITTIAKSNIVVRNIKVVHANYMSNMALLASKGIPVHEILKLSREAINSAMSYQGINHKLNMAVAHRDVIANKTSLSQAQKDTQLKALDRIIMRLEDEKAKNPSTAMIASGLLPSIVDDVDTSRIESPFKFGLEKFLDDSLNKLPSQMEQATRVLFMTTDTEGYRMMNNAVKMTDYVGRYVVYHHYTKKMGLGHTEAISRAVDEFINFDIPTHKMIEYSNSVGLLWFSRYQLRVLKHIKNMISTAPFTALTVYILGEVTGLGDNIINSIPGFTKGTFQNFGSAWGTLATSSGDILYADMVGKIGSSIIQ